MAPLEYKSGGDASTPQWDINAFSQSPAIIEKNFELDAAFKRGNILFRGQATGRGPLLNSAVCQGCHIKDGRGHPPLEENEPFTSMLLKLSAINPQDDSQSADPIYGSQLQTFAIDTENSEALIEASYAVALDGQTVAGEAAVRIEYEEIPGTYPDGSPYQLRQPTYIISKPSYGEFAQNLIVSPRTAPPMIGLGLLDAIPDAALIAQADEHDVDADGISGKVKYVLDPSTNTTEIGRFGWKASSASVLQQTAGALMNDMGVSTPYTPDEPCSALQAACVKKASQESKTEETPDMGRLSLASIEFYSRLLAVPERRGYDRDKKSWQEDIVAGKQLFTQINCSGCHTPYYQTEDAPHSVLGRVRLTVLIPDNTAIKALSQQHIWPYTDLLLHDMGGQCGAAVRETESKQACTTGEGCFWVQRCEGLADGRIDGSANGQEWRTAPLWGIGLTQVVDPKARFLHDGRARTIEEAILWHGGEAENSVSDFKNLSAQQRQDLLSFLESL